MTPKVLRSIQWILPTIIGMCLLVLLFGVAKVGAITPIPTPQPQAGSYGLEATKRQAPPKVGATITTPGSGASYSTSPIAVNGICPNGLLVEVFNNNVMVGSVMCNGGSFTMQVSLFAGTNELYAIVYDELGQPGPKSNIVTVNYSPTQFAAFGQLITLTSSYGRRSAPTGTLLEWPLQLSGGTGPYAFSIDWGDGTPLELKSQAFGGVVMISHVYKKAGIYQVNVKVTDANGVSAFLQLVAVASGEVTGNSEPSPPAAGTKVVQGKPQILWWPQLVLMLLLLPTYWLGRRSMLVSIRNKMLKERDQYKA